MTEIHFPSTSRFRLQKNLLNLENRFAMQLMYFVRELHTFKPTIIISST